MKRKIFVFALALIFAAINVYAETGIPQNIYLQDFSITTDVSQSITPEDDNSFSAEVSDGALDMKTDSLCFFRASSAFSSSDEANSPENSRGLTYYNKWWHTGFKLDAPQDIVHTDKKTYTVNYKVTVGGSNALLLDEVEGLTAIGFHTFNNQDRPDKPVNTPDVKFVVDSGAVTSTDNNVKFRFRVYAERANTPLKMAYVKADDKKTANTTLLNIAEDEVGKWITKEVDVSNIDLTALISQDSGSNLQQYTIRLSTNLGYDIYLHSIEILKETEEINCYAGSNMYQVKINENPLYGDVDFSYDLTFPSGEACITDVCGDACVTDCIYNTEKNQLTVNLLNQDMTEIAAVQYDLDGDMGTVSLAYTDESGNTALEQIYQGELVGKEYRYILSYDMTNEANMFSICEGENVVAQTEAPFGIVNKDEAAKTFVQYYSIRQNQSSKAIYSRIDNISISFMENTIYKSFVEDMEAIELPGTVREDFALPVVGSMNGSYISWESADTGAIIIDGSTALVNRGVEEDITVTLTATISDGMFNVSADFEVTLKALKGEFAEWLDITEADNGQTVTASTTLNNAGTTGAGKILFVAVSYINGEIADRAVCEMDVLSQYQSIDFEVTVKKGDEIKYFLWDENNVPIVNHAPHIYKASFYDKVKGAVVEWEKAYDDFDAIDTYQLKRSDGKVFITDGEVSGENMLRFFDDEASESSAYTYELTAFDSNQKTSDSITGQAKRLTMPYSMDMTVTFASDGTYNGGNHINFIYKSDPDRAAYTEHGVYEGEECTFIPSGKYAAFTTDLSDISKNIAVRFTYASSVETKLKFMYNGKQPDGSFAEVSETVKAYPATDGWQTLDFKLENEFRSGNSFSAGHFGLGTASPGGVYIKKVEFVKLEDYE
ncbi:MAG: hypothetical protein IJ460_06725 [Clostridia bacterium]|nr:hypothetical protein [Clostridia bacterium]